MIKICFYCDSIFSVGGVQRILAVIAGAISAKHEVTILTLDKPEQEDLNMYELGQRNIRFRYISLPPIGKWEYLPCKTYSYLYKKRIIPQSLSPHNGMDIAHSHTHNGKFSSVN